MTVVDLSPEMLRQDVQEAARRNLSVRAIEGSMDDLSMLADESFDIVHQPVSTCYVPDVAAVYREVARVLRDGGLVHQPAQAAGQPADRRARCARPVRPRRAVLSRRSAAAGRRYDSIAKRGPSSSCTAGRTWSEVCAGPGLPSKTCASPCRADAQAAAGHFGHRGQYVPPYVRIKARRVSRKTTPLPAAVLWTP